jgi:hypothetical protein
MVKLTPLLRDLLPTGLYDRVSHLFGADTSMAHWTGREGDTEATHESELESASQDRPEAKR